MDWKVRLEGDESALTKLTTACSSPDTRVTRDGIEWFLESKEFETLMDHVEVKEKATLIVHSALASGTESGAPANIVLGPVYRIHYDNSKTVFR